jgi:DeoR/GlpR family transcriptional regulator of sugar metabolism
MAAKPKRVGAEERHARILRDLKINPALRVAHLAKAFGVTTETVRRDLDTLSADGRLARTYGGAAAAPGEREPAFHERQNRLFAERSRIGARAAAMIRPGEVLMIDSGSTTLHFARHLVSHSRDLTVITNSLAIAATLSVNDTIRVVVCPGDYDSREGGVFGVYAYHFLQGLNADRAVVGASGLGVRGPSDAISDAAVLKRAMMAQSDRTTLLADASKYGERHLEAIHPWNLFDEIVVDEAPPRQLAAALREAGVRIWIAR